MKTIKLLNLLLIVCSTFTSMQLLALINANEHKNIIDRGIATDETQNIDTQAKRYFRNKDFNNIRFYVDASKCYTNSHLEVVAENVD